MGVGGAKGGPKGVGGALGFIVYPAQPQGSAPQIPTSPHAQRLLLGDLLAMVKVEP